MPNKQRHRGQHPNDVILFGTKYQQILEEGVSDLSYLLSRGYAEKSALKLIGDRYQLKTRQRMSIMRRSCSDQSLQTRNERHITPTNLKGKKIAIDGYNLLITIESALSNGILLKGRDGCYRDLASVHGSYKKVEETLPALKIIGDTLKKLEVGHVQWYLDKPVSNSGRLKGIMYEMAETHQFNWDIELDFNPDRVLAGIDAIVITSDGWILDEATAWTNLTEYILKEHQLR